MKVTIQIENPIGVLRLKGDDSDSVLYLDSISIQFTWIREIGSIWRYHIVKSIDNDESENIFRTSKCKNQEYKNRYLDKCS